MPRRGDADPLLLQTVSRRLARLLAETPPRRADEAEEAEPATEQTARATAWGSDAPLVDTEEVPPPRRFGRRHLVVVCVLLLVGLTWTGWSMLRARPVALASPVGVPASAPAAPAPWPTAGISAGPVPSGSPAATASPSGRPVAGVVVHVLGAVRRPGLVELPERARVQDAVDAAGGFRRDADPGDLNLAQLLQDGQQVVIGTTSRPTGEVRGSDGASGSGGAAGRSGTGSGSAGAGSGDPGTPLDLNTATESQLDGLPGVGPVTAGKILAWRTEHGRFSRVEELQEVDGIGPKTYAELAPHVGV